MELIDESWYSTQKHFIEVGKLPEGNHTEKLVDFPVQHLKKTRNIPEYDNFLQELQFESFC